MSFEVTADQMERSPYPAAAPKDFYEEINQCVNLRASRSRASAKEAGVTNVGLGTACWWWV